MKEESQSEQAMNSLDGMSRAAMPEALRERIIAAVSKRRVRIIDLSRTPVMLLAAGLALLICLNVYSLILRPADIKTEAVIKQHGSNPLTDEYFSPAPSI